MKPTSVILLLLALAASGCTGTTKAVTAPTITVLSAPDLAHVMVKVSNAGSRDLTVSASDFTLIDATNRSYPMDFLAAGTWQEDGRFPSTTLAPGTFAQGFLSFTVDDMRGPYTLRTAPNFGLANPAAAMFNLTPS